MGILNMHAEQKPYTVITFGDSTTAPRGDLKIYTGLLAEKFPAIKFINKGKGGNNTKDAVARLPEDVISNKPNLVIIQYGINDSCINLSKEPPATAPPVSLSSFEENLRKIIDTITNSGSEVILMTPNQLRWTPNLKNIYGKPPYDPDSELGFNVLLADYAQVIRKLAMEYKVPLVDVYAMYDRPSADSFLLDGMHPNDKGQKLVADALQPLIAKKTTKNN